MASVIYEWKNKLAEIRIRPATAGFVIIGSIVIVVALWLFAGSNSYSSLTQAQRDAQSARALDGAFNSWNEKVQSQGIRVRCQKKLRAAATQKASSD